jgi:hypothetical protein
MIATRVNKTSALVNPTHLVFLVSAFSIVALVAILLILARVRHAHAVATTLVVYQPPIERRPSEAAICPRTSHRKPPRVAILSLQIDLLAYGEHKSTTTQPATASRIQGGSAAIIPLRRLRFAIGFTVECLTAGGQCFP